MKARQSTAALLNIFVVTGLVDWAAATLPTATTQVQVKNPAFLTKLGGYDHRDGLFGDLPFGSTIQHNVYYTENHLCKGPLSPKQMESDLWPNATNRSLDDEPFFLLIDRGDCTFVQKVRNGQQMGAAAVLLGDNSCLCPQTNCTPSFEGQTCQKLEPMMADDGSGSDITIPSVLLFKQDADAIKNVLKDDNSPVVMELSFLIPSPDDRVEYSLWFVPLPAKTLTPLLTEFKAYSQALGQQAFFTPHYFLYDGLAVGCQSANGTDQCVSLCTNSGKYCYSDNNWGSDISGEDVVKESLRQICIWSHYGEADGIGIVWWDYVNVFMSQCTSKKYSDDECINSAFKSAGVDSDKINRCMMDSGGLKGDVVNHKLEMELKAKEESQVALLPAVQINGAMVRGATTPKAVFEGICAGYVAGSQPGICGKCVGCEWGLEKCVTAGRCGGDDRVEYSIWLVPLPSKIMTPLLTDFKAYSQALGQQAVFTPHYFLYDGLAVGCQSANETDQCVSLCTNNGRYCYKDDNLGTISGKQVVEESLRQICIWSYYGPTDKYTVVWWDYVNVFISQCSADKYSDVECINSAYKSAGVDGDRINQCMINSGGLEGDVVNVMLERELKRREESKVSLIPTVQINGAAMSGSVTPNMVFEGVCAGFAIDSRPGICTKCVGCRSGLQECVISGACGGGSNGINTGNDALNDFIQKFGVDIEECGINLASLMADEDESGGTSGPMQNPMAGYMAFMNDLKFSDPCSNDQKTVFRDALLEFQACSGYELLGLIALLPSALSGAARKCVDALSLAGIDDICDDACFDVCADAFLGDHPLGKALRGMILHSGKTSQCLYDLSQTVPQCSLDLWPFSVDGKTVKTGLCLLSKVNDIGDVPCSTALMYLDTCLPTDKDDVSSDDCDSYVSRCSSGNPEVFLLNGVMMLPKHLQGIPIPESCGGVADRADIVERYDAFRSACALEGSQLWSKLDSDSPSDHQLDTFQTFLAGGMSPTIVENSSDDGPKESKEELLAWSAAPASQNTSSGGAAESFAYGLVGGLILSALSIFGLVVVWKKRRGVEGSNSTAVEMTKYDQVPHDAFEIS